MVSVITEEFELGSKLKGVTYRSLGAFSFECVFVFFGFVFFLIVSRCVGDISLGAQLIPVGNQAGLKYADGATAVANGPVYTVVVASAGTCLLLVKIVFSSFFFSINAPKLEISKGGSPKRSPKGASVSGLRPLMCKSPRARHDSRR